MHEVRVIGAEGQGDQRCKDSIAGNSSGDRGQRQNQNQAPQDGSEPKLNNSEPEHHLPRCLSEEKYRGHPIGFVRVAGVFPLRHFQVPTMDDVVSRAGKLALVAIRLPRHGRAGCQREIREDAYDPDRSCDRPFCRIDRY